MLCLGKFLLEQCYRDTVMVDWIPNFDNIVSWFSGGFLKKIASLIALVGQNCFREKSSKSHKKSTKIK